jgi:hypothetical protein
MDGGSDGRGVGYDDNSAVERRFPEIITGDTSRKSSNQHKI